ncbi:TPR and ankyrin repeat-containing protein 1 [Gastrophryne carolinensis]
MLKGEGNELFKGGHYLQALEKYQNAIAVMASVFPLGESHEMAVLWNNRANALFKLGKFEEAYISAQESLRIDPRFTKAYFRAGQSLLMLNDVHNALQLFMHGLISQVETNDPRVVVDFLHGIFKTFEGGNSFDFSSVHRGILREGYSTEVWKLLIAKLVKENMFQSCLLLMNSKLPKNITGLNRISLAGIFKMYAGSSYYLNTSHIVELVIWLINLGADVETIGDLPLHSVMKVCMRSMDNRLFTFVFNNKPAMKQYINSTDAEGNTVLHMVASSLTNSFGYTLKRQTQDVKMLLSYGADPRIVNKQKKDVASLLKQMKNFKAESVIKSHLVNQTQPTVQASKPTEPSSIPENEGSSFASALEEFINLCKEASQPETFMKHKSVKRFLHVLSLMKDIPCKITCEDIPDCIAEHLITQLIQQKKWQEVLLLLSRDASGENLQEGLIKSCQFPKIDIHYVIHHFDPAVQLRLPLVKLLLEHGVSPNGIGAMCEHPITACLKKSDFALAHMLLSAGGDPDSLFIKKGDCPLHVAVSIALNNKGEYGVLMTKYLLDLYCSDPLKYKNLDPNLQDKDGDTVMHKVFQSNNPKQYSKIIDLLAKFDIKLTISNKLGRDAKYKIKNTDQRFVTWIEARKKYKHVFQCSVPKLVKTAGNLTQVKIQAKPPMSSEIKCNHHVIEDHSASKQAKFSTEVDECSQKTLTRKEQLVQVIRSMITSLDLSKAHSLFDKLNQPSSENAVDMNNIKVPFDATNCSTAGDVFDNGFLIVNNNEDTVNEIVALDIDGDNMNGEQSDENIDLSNIDFSNMAWEIECSPEALKKLGSKFVPKNMKNKIIFLIQMLGNGEWTRSLNKQLKVKSSIKLFEVKLDKGGRMLWELAIDFSPRCSEAPEKILATELASEKNGRVYTEIIRIWDIVLDHCKLYRAIENICSAYDRGLSCILRKKLKRITGRGPFCNTPKRIPECFVEDLGLENAQHDVIPDYFPPASAAETEYNIMKFHSFSTDMALNILCNMTSRVEYPFRVGELEYAVIDLNPKPIEAIILIGRSGTGKTTCCLYRLWKKFHSYWQQAELVGGPWLVKQTWQRKKYHENIEGDVENRENSETELSDSDEEQASEEIADEETEVHMSDDEESLVKLEHYHPIFITKNQVLCQEVQRNFLELSKSTKATSHFKPAEPKIYRLQDIQNEYFPLFLTSQQLLLLLDASMPEPFFPRNEDGSLKKSIAGWSTMDDADMLDLLREGDESESDSEDDAEEEINELKDSDPRIFVTFELFAKKLWPKMVKGKSVYNAALVWKEIKSFLKGSFEALNCCHGRLSEEAYIKLGKKRAPNFQGDRKEIYRLFCMYEQIKNNHGYFDEEDVLYNLSCRLSKLEELPWSIHELYGDEIQDFTQAELFLLMRCINDPNSMFLTGDTAQSIMKGVAFRFSDLRSLFYFANKKCSNEQKKCIVRKPKQLYHLYQNYRSHSGILNLASGVVDLLQHFFPESFDRLPRDCGLFPGPKPTVLESCSVSDLALLLRGNKRKTQPIEFGAHQVILVTNDFSKENIPEELSLALVLTIYEAKGLEFDDVLLYNFFTDSEAAKEWRIISSFSPAKSTNQENQPLIEVPLETACSTSNRPLTLDPELHKMLNGELKQLYTAITRARVNLWIFDENKEKRAPAFNYFVKGNFVKVVYTDEDKDLDDNMFVKTSTREEWISRGDYYANHKCWKVAAKCFQKGGALEKEKLAFAHDQVLVLQNQKASAREKLLGYIELAKTYLECQEPKMALKCLNKAKEYTLCAELCQQMKKIKEAAYFYKKAQSNKLAAELFEQAGEYEAALNLYYREKMYIEAINAIERHQTRYPGIPLQLTEKKFYLEGAENYFKNKNLSKMSEMLSRLDTEDQLVFLKKRKCWTEAAELLKCKDRCEEAASLMREHGKLLEAANLTRRIEFRASCLLSAARQKLATDEDPSDVLAEALKLFGDTSSNIEATEALLLQGVSENSLKKISDAFFKFRHAAYHAGVAESLFLALACEEPNPKLLFMALFGLESLVCLLKALKETRTNAERDMVRSCLDFFGIVQLDEQQCSVLKHEGARFCQILKEENVDLWDLKDVKLVLQNHFLKNLCDIAETVLAKNYPSICSNYIVGLDCVAEDCPHFHQPLQQFELKSILRSKINVITVCGWLIEARNLNEDYSDVLDNIVKTYGFKYCESLLGQIFTKHFHLRILSENTKICREILLNISTQGKTVLNSFLLLFLRESKENLRQSTDLWLQIMQICSLLSRYPDGLQCLLEAEEKQYEIEYAKQMNKVHNPRGERIKHLEGRYGMLKPDTSDHLPKESHVHFFRLLQASVDELYDKRNPDSCKKYFYRFMNLLVKKCIEPLIPNIGNTVMLIEFQLILCLSVLMRFSGCMAWLPKSYISILHFWETMFRKKNSLKDTYTILWEYKPQNVTKLIAHFRHHLHYLVRVLFGEENYAFNVLLDAFKCVGYVSSGEAERTLVLSLVLMLNLPDVGPLLKPCILKANASLKDLQNTYPLRVPDRLVMAVERLASTTKEEDVFKLLEDLLAQRDSERLVQCSWRWDIGYGKGQIRGIYFNDSFRFQKYTSLYFQNNTATVKPTCMELEEIEEEKSDLLTAVAVQARKQKAARNLNMLFVFSYIYTKWKKVRTRVWKRHIEEFVPNNFQRANIDRTQCDLCGVKFFQTVVVSHASEMEEDTEEATPTMSSIEELEIPKMQDFKEGYEEHIMMEKHQQQIKAYKEYLDFFKLEVDAVINEGRSCAQTIATSTRKTSTSYDLLQAKMKEKMKIVADLMDDIYEQKSWSQAKDLLTNPVDNLKTAISELELLATVEHQTTNIAGFQEDYEVDYGSFEELCNNKSRRRKKKAKRH